MTHNFKQERSSHLNFWGDLDQSSLTCAQWRLTQTQSTSSLVSYKQPPLWKLWDAVKHKTEWLFAFHIPAVLHSKLYKDDMFNVSPDKHHGFLLIRGDRRLIVVEILQKHLVWTIPQENRFTDNRWGYDEGNKRFSRSQTRWNKWFSKLFWIRYDMIG